MGLVDRIKKRRQERVSVGVEKFGEVVSKTRPAAEKVGRAMGGFGNWVGRGIDRGIQHIRESNARRAELKQVYRESYHAEAQKQAKKAARDAAKRSYRQPKYASQERLFGSSSPGLGGLFKDGKPPKKKKGGGLFDQL